MPITNFVPSGFDVRAGGAWFQDFDSNSISADRLYWKSQLTAGAVSFITAPDNGQQFGVLQLDTGGTVTGAAGIIRGVNNFLRNPLGCTIEYHIRLPTASDGTNNYSIFVGYGDTAAAEPSDGAYFKYNHALNTGNWTLTTANGGVRTEQNSGSQAAIGIFLALGIRFVPNLEQVQFTVNRLPIGNITTNLPSPSTLIGMIARIAKTAGALQRFLQIDYVDFKYACQR